MFDFLATGEVIIFTNRNENNEFDYSVLVIDKLKDNDVVGCSQTKNKSIQNHSFANPSDADKEFFRASMFFIDNNWTVSYRGCRNEG